jgi:bifunctional DNase/RNase
VQLVEVRVDLPSNSPIVVLKDNHGNRCLPIRIGAVEATAIAFAQQGLVSLRPLTHDLFRDVLKAVGIQLLSARVTSLTDGIFNGDLVLSNGSNVRARPSDAIALAIHAGAMIEASTEVIEEAGVEVPDEQAPASD